MNQGLEPMARYHQEKPLSEQPTRLDQPELTIP